MLEVSKAVQRVAAVERKAAQEARAAAEAEKQQRMKAEEDLAAQQQETLQLRAFLKVWCMTVLKTHNIFNCMELFCWLCFGLSNIHDQP